jgi:hypothetical protein
MTDPAPTPPPLPDAHSIARTRWERDAATWLRETLKVRLGRRQLAALTRIADAYAERCEQFAVEQEREPLARELASTKDALDLYLENKCPKCNEFLHPRAKRCGTCQANAEREMYTKELSTLSDLLGRAHKERDTLRRHVELAMKALTHGRREKKKGKFVRQALAILEAATTEDHPQVSKLFGSLGGVGLLAALTVPLMGYFLKRDPKTPNGPPAPPPPEQAAPAP